MKKPHNKIELDHEYILSQWVDGRSSDDIAEQFLVSQIVILRHIKEAAGENYDSLRTKHWKNLHKIRKEKTSGAKTKGGNRWFNNDDESRIIGYFLNSNDTYDEIAKKFNCSRVVIKRLLERRVPPEKRHKRNTRAKAGKRLVKYIKKQCPSCEKYFEVPPWKNRQGVTYCSRRCKGSATSGENCTWLYGKTNHAVGDWYQSSHGEIWLRSQWEHAFACYLDQGCVRWRYEPKSFPIVVNGKKTTYTPDFYLVDEDRYIEIKGYWRPRYIEKHRVFCDTYPEIKINVYGKSELLQLNLINSKGRAIKLGQ